MSIKYSYFKFWFITCDQSIWMIKYYNYAHCWINYSYHHYCTPSPSFSSCNSSLPHPFLSLLFLSFSLSLPLSLLFFCLAAIPYSNSTCISPQFSPPHFTPLSSSCHLPILFLDLSLFFLMKSRKSSALE